MTVILGLDPGGKPMSAKSRSATGWSIWEFDDATAPRLIAKGMVQGDHRVFVRWWQRELPDALAYHMLDVVVCESFALDGRTARPDTTPLKIEGALAVLWPETHFQPNTMKLHMSDRKMKELGLWWPGPGHDRDSMRHVFAYLKTNIRHRPTLELWRAAQV